jgi:hypothetical protein
LLDGGKLMTGGREMVGKTFAFGEGMEAAECLFKRKLWMCCILKEEF